ncbi:NAD(P)-binding protein [Porticoccaceae bacterium]|nr:NAD(P)-binding protein [Porticoccaceae bacterium]
MSKNNILVVGAGFSGAVVARTLADAGWSVHVIDSRNHIGGNAYDETNEHGIRYHKYGPHIFHTNNKKVFDWLSNYTEWEKYKHKVLARLADGKNVVLPPNKKTIECLGSKQGVVDVLFRPYTKKMWGMTIEEIDPSIVDRVAIRDDDNEYYFPSDKYQFMPKHGYTNLFENILDHQNIQVSLNNKFSKSMEDDYFYIFNSMPLDEYHDFKYGELPYRSIKFHHVFLPFDKVLPSPTMNFTHELPYTRITEWKLYPCHEVTKTNTTHLTYEEPCDYKDNHYERYYPVKDISGKNRKIYERYKSLKHPKMTFIGRCGLYVYIDMHQAVSSALAASNKWIKENDNVEK